MNKDLARQTLDRIKELLVEETPLVLEERQLPKREIGVLPITHNENKIILQFWGWSINLLEDGTYFWEATDGG